MFVTVADKSHLGRRRKRQTDWSNEMPNTTMDNTNVLFTTCADIKRGFFYDAAKKTGAPQNYAKQKNRYGTESDWTNGGVRIQLSPPTSTRSPLPGVTADQWVVVKKPLSQWWPWADHPFPSEDKPLEDVEFTNKDSLMVSVSEGGATDVELHMRNIAIGVVINRHKGRKGNKSPQRWY